MKNIIKFMMRHDSTFHLLAGLVVYLISWPLFNLWFGFFAIIPVIVIGALKELRDHLKGGYADGTDFLYTLFGGFAGLLVNIIFVFYC